MLAADMRTNAGWFVCGVLVLLMGSARADVFAFTDENGVTHFTNFPVPGDRRFKLVLKTPRPAIERQSGTNSRVRLKTEGGRLAGVHAPAIAGAANEFQVDEALIRAVIYAESGFNPSAVSQKGAMGLMQLMPATARRYGVSDPFDSLENVRGGTRYLHDLLGLFNNDIELTVAAYNAGEQAVIRHGNRIPPYRETLEYVPRVLSIYRDLRARM